METINTPREYWYAFWRRIRQAGAAHRYRGDDPFIEKQRIIDAIAKYEQNGVVRLCDRFMDCDHAVSTSSRVIKANYYSYIRYLDLIYDGVEGPGTTWLDYPGNIPERNSRDLALEAFEDGHPHTVSEVRYDNA
jgi:hypothetical protein